MSTNVNQLSDMILTDILVPNINDVSYASTLQEAFNNINKNFETLSNHEFIKGDSGSSVKIMPVDFYIDGEITVYGKKLKECINNLGRPEERNDIVLNGKTYKLFDYFEQHPGKIQMIYNTDEFGDPIACSSLYYVFLDGRYAHNELGNASDEYNNIKDFSCIVVYDETFNDGLGGFKALSNAFPTIYYEDNVGLCWKINGNGTGIPVAGATGKDGDDAELIIVKAKPVDTTNANIVGTEIIGIYESYFGFAPISEYSNISQFDNKSALILCTSVDDTSNNLFYFGKLFLRDNKLHASISHGTSINSAIETQNVLNIFKNIDILKSNNPSNGLKGLFVPISKEKNGKQPVHLLSATSIINSEGLNSDNNDFIITPVKDINNLIVSDNDNSKLEIDRYLYLRLNDEHNIYSANDISKPNNGYLKYRLENIVYYKNSPYFSKYNSSTNPQGVLKYGHINFYEKNGDVSKIELNSDNTSFVAFKYGNSTTVLTDHFSSMKMETLNRLAENDTEYNKDTSKYLGLYRWVLCKDINKDFDVDELLNSVDSDATKYEYDDIFNVIFTTTLTPSQSTDFLWFNAFCTADGFDNQKIGGDYVVPGWNNFGDESIFKFIKFVPIYNSSETNLSPIDTALNINYDVNITGNNNNYKKNLTVHGDVNCDNLSVYKLTATGQIKNIYTEDDIVSTSGIKIGPKDEYNCSIDSEGNIAANSIVVNGDIIGNMDNNSSLYMNDVISESVSTKKIQIGDVNSGASINTGYTTAVTIDKVSNININGNKITLNGLNGYKYTAPIIRSDVSSNLNGNSTVVISNNHDNSDVYYDMNEADKDGKSPGGGVSTVATMGVKRINKTSFDSAKNFNMHRLSLVGSGGAITSKSKSVNFSNLPANTSTNTSKPWILNSEVSERQASCSASTQSTIDFAYASENYLQKATIQKSETTKNLNENYSISLNIINNFWTLIGIYGKCQYGKWCQLHSDSYMELGVYYSVGNTLYSTGLTKKYNFDYSTSSSENTNEFKWIGVKENGTEFEEDNLDLEWRYRSYVIKPSSFTLTPTSEIVTAFNSGKPITFYIVPKFKISAFSQGSKYCVKGVRATCPRAVSVTSNSAQQIKLYSGTSPKGDYKFPINKNVATNLSTIDYTVNSMSNDNTNTSQDTVKNTVICNDGIVMRAGNYVFGLGYAKNVVDHSKNGYDINNQNGHWIMKDPSYYKEQVPVLFYHKYSDSYYDSEKNPLDSSNSGKETKDSKGYARRTNAIPLEDIFEAIKVLRGNDMMTYGL